VGRTGDEPSNAVKQEAGEASGLPRD